MMAQSGGMEKKSMTNRKLTLGVIVGNRNFFPALLAKAGREDIIGVLAKKGFDSVVLSPEETKYGVVETLEDSRKCADLFRRNRDRIDGVIVTLPNFGDERAVANTLRYADLKVPVLVQATPDATGEMTIEHRRDSFCGKMSVCNNLRQYGIPYSLTRLHTVGLDSEEFDEDLDTFAATCRVVKASRICGSAASAPGQPPSIPSVSARRSWRRTAFRSRRWTCPTLSGALKS